MPPEERQHALVVFFARRLVEVAAVGEGVAVMRAHLGLDARRKRRGGQELLELRHVGQRHVGVVLGEGIITLGRDVAEHEMRRVGLVGDQARSVVRREAGDAVRMRGGSGRHEGATHAVADQADLARLGIGHRRQPVQDDSGIGRHLGVGDRLQEAEHPRPVGLGVGMILRRAAHEVADGAVVQVGQQHIIAGLRNTPADLPKTFANAGRVHQHQHDRQRPAVVRPDAVGVHGAIGRGNIECAFNHGRTVPAPRAMVYNRRLSLGSRSETICRVRWKA